MRIVFFGTPEMAAETLRALIAKQADIVAIVTKPDAAQGRSSKLVSPPVKEVAPSHIPIYQPEKCSTSEMIEILRSLNADLFVVVAYGEILSESLLATAKYGAINVHYSLLPAYRGAAPVQRAIMNGEKETGVSVIRLVKKMDAGDVLYAKSMPITDAMTGGELAKSLCSLGIECLFTVLDNFSTIQATVQDHSKVTFANKITPEDCHLDWKKPAKDLYNMVRAVSPHPGAWCEVQVKGEKKRLKVFACDVVDAPSKTELVVPCAEGYLRLTTIQLEGKPKMQASDFLRGVPASHIAF